MTSLAPPDIAAPDLATIAQNGVAALSRGDAAAARDAFDEVAAAGRATPQLWLLLAQSSSTTGRARTPRSTSFSGSTAPTSTEW
jgi:hypothetical protein